MDVELVLAEVGLILNDLLPIMDLDDEQLKKIRDTVEEYAQPYADTINQLVPVLKKIPLPVLHKLVSNVVFCGPTTDVDVVALQCPHKRAQHWVTLFPGKPGLQVKLCSFCYSALVGQVLESLIPRYEEPTNWAQGINEAMDKTL